MRKVWKSSFVILILLISIASNNIVIKAFSDTASDYKTFFAEERFFADSPTIFSRKESEELFGKYNLIRGIELSDWENNGIEIEANKLYLVDGEERSVKKLFSDVSVIETNIYQLPYSVQQDGVYAIENESTLLKISKDGKNRKTIFKADNGKTIKDFLIAENIAWIFSNGVIYRAYLPDGTVEPVFVGIEEIGFCQFLSPISNYKIAWCEYAPEYWEISEREGFLRNKRPNESEIAKYDSFLIAHSNIPTFILRYCDLTTRKNSQADYYVSKDEDAKNTAWWKSSKNIQPQTYFYLGDINHDGTVTGADARLALRQSVAMEQLSEGAIAYADYDNDGAVTPADARMILRLSVLLESLIIRNQTNMEYEELAPSKKELQDKWLLSFSEGISYNDIKSDMKWLVEKIGTRNWWGSTQNDSADLIYEKLKSFGYKEKDCKIIKFSKGKISGKNVMAVIPTAVKNPKILLVTAHYDTVRNTGGAVDNASGSAALLQLAKRFKLANQDFGIELRFLFTAGEEQGYYGAYAYVNSLSDAEKARHIFTFNIDMAGKPNDLYSPGCKYYLTVCTEPVSTNSYKAPAAKKNIGSNAIDKTKSAFGNIGEDGYFSPVRAGKHDIVPFRKAGIKALTLSWRCISSERSNGSDYDLATPAIIHTSSDNLYYFDMTSLYKTTRLAAGAIARLLLPYVKSY
ncbi:MAG: M20/M25/M40 family metallo-hydrolase [Oscillospiraceae bacterium]|nr:M20/M25/M40 family metallo-hydrolase [Oscillospiraceae bacterium]